MPYADLGDYRLYYEETGPESPDDLKDKRPLVFLHGFTLDRRMWSREAERFGRAYRVIVPDALAHGLSDAPATGYSRGDRVEHLRRFLDKLEIARAHVIGLSMGGSTAIGLALDYPDRMASMTLVDSGVAGFSSGKRIGHIDQIAREKGLEAARRKWMKTALVFYKQDKAHIKQLLATMMAEHSGAVWMDEMRGKYPRLVDLEVVERITVPTMIFVGELDRIFVPLAQELNRKIKTSRLSIFEGVGHMLNLEAPERFELELDQFLGGLEID